MHIIKQKFIHRDDLRNNRDVLYVFGDNVQQTGFGGQAKHMRGEPNAVGIPTKWSPSMKPDAFFHTHDDLQVPMVRARFQFLLLQEHLSQGGVIVFPADGIGTGLARLEETAPDYFRFIEDQLAELYKIAGKEKGT